jgi:hypothetical protein
MPMYRIILAGMIPGFLGATIGWVTGFLQWSQLLPVDAGVDSLKFQNFAVFMSSIAGFLFGLIAFAIFLVSFKSYRHPASRLGSRIGAASGAALFFFTNLVLNILAPSFDFVRSVPVVFISNSLITSLAGGVGGLAAGYLLAEIGARNLYYSENTK